MRKILICLALALWPTVAGANTYYVSLSGSNGNSCATAQSSVAANAKLTVRAAIGCAVANNGDAILIHAGTYTNSDDFIDSQTYTIPTGTNFTNGLHIGPVVGDTVIIQGANPVRLNAGALSLYATINGLHFDGNSGTANDTVFTSATQFVILSNCEVMGAASFGVHIASDNTTVQNCSIHDNGTVGMGSTNGHGIYDQASGALIQGNDVYNNRGYGIHCYDNTGSLHTGTIIRQNKVHGNGLNGGTTYGITVTWQSSPLVYNNLVYAQTASGAGAIQCYTNSTNCGIYNNSVYNVTAECGANQFYGSSPQWTNNICSSTGSGIVDYGGTSGSVTKTTNLETFVSSGFTNAAGNDFTLTAGSPALDVGTSLASIFTTDFIGTTRPQGSAWDVGAYERMASPSNGTRWSPPQSPGFPSTCNPGELFNLTTGGNGVAGAYKCDTPNVWVRL